MKLNLFIRRAQIVIGVPFGFCQQVYAATKHMLSKDANPTGFVEWAKLTKFCLRMWVEWLHEQWSPAVFGKSVTDVVTMIAQRENKLVTNEQKAAIDAVVKKMGGE